MILDSNICYLLTIGGVYKQASCLCSVPAKGSESAHTKLRAAVAVLLLVPKLTYLGTMNILEEKHEAKCRSTVSWMMAQRGSK